MITAQQAKENTINNKQKKDWTHIYQNIENEILSSCKEGYDSCIINAIHESNINPIRRYLHNQGFETFDVGTNTSHLIKISWA